MARYLSVADVPAVLRRARGVQVFLGPGRYPGSIRWASLRPVQDGVMASVYEVIAGADPKFLDVSSFAPVPGAGYEGQLEDRLFADAENGIRYLVVQWGADDARFVNDGVVQDEYADFRAAGRQEER